MLHPLGFTKQNIFTIEIHDEDDAYVICEQDGSVHTRPGAEVYEIAFVREDIYKYMLATPIVRAVSDTAPTGSTYTAEKWR